MFQIRIHGRGGQGVVSAAEGPGKRFLFNLDYRKGCGICVPECPCGAIKMVPAEA
jgi:Pyruvate/2-oxoacid:ferredoxin oxidoreductase delta subunit